MKKVHLFAIAFLVGITAQASINTAHSSATPQGNNDRYLNSQSVSFVEDGVMYEVFLNGSFQFDLPFNQNNYRGRKVKTRNGNAYGLSRQRVNRRIFNMPIFKDRHGVIHTIGQTQLTYNRYGRVNRIGSVKLNYSRGKLQSVGGMHIIYNRRGTVAHTIGHINAQNRTYGVCAVGPAIEYDYVYNRRNRLEIPRRYSGINIVNGNHPARFDWDDSWEINNNTGYARVERRVRH
jgi:hypothetical protein